MSASQKLFEFKQHHWISKLSFWGKMCYISLSNQKIWKSQLKSLLNAWCVNTLIAIEIKIQRLMSCLNIRNCIWKMNNSFWNSDVSLLYVPYLLLENCFISRIFEIFFKFCSKMNKILGFILRVICLKLCFLLWLHCIFMTIYLYNRSEIG